MFDSNVPWSTMETWGSRMVWLRCYGLPLHFWNVACFSKVVSTFGLKVDADNAILTRLAYARILVKAYKQIYILLERISINGHIIPIRTIKASLVPGLE